MEDVTCCDLKIELGYKDSNNNLVIQDFTKTRKLAPAIADGLMPGTREFESLKKEEY